MKRIAFVVAILVLAFVACDEKEAPCTVDTECPQGFICREGRCGPVAGDASAPIDASPPVVVEDAAVPAPPRPTCRELYELCQADCCPGLTCIQGACR